MVVLKISNRNILKNLSFSIFMTIISIIFTIIFYEDYHRLYFIVGLIYFFSPVVLSLLLLLDYVKFSFKGEIHVTSRKLKVIDNKSGLEKTYTNKEISKIEVFAAPSLRRLSKFQLFAFEQFHYCKIYTSSEDIFYVTSILDPNVYKSLYNFSPLKKKLVFPNQGITNKGSLINSIWWNELKD